MNEIREKSEKEADLQPLSAKFHSWDLYLGPLLHFGQTETGALASWMVSSMTNNLLQILGSILFFPLTQHNYCS
jgi:hypothetical protein